MITQQVLAINMTNHFTRKHTTVLHLTVCCDGNKQFLNINAEQSARCHDSHIFQHFQLFTILNNGQNSTQYHTYVKNMLLIGFLQVLRFLLGVERVFGPVMDCRY